MGEIIKILYVNYSLDTGGIETLILELSRRIDKTRFSPAVCVFADNGRLHDEFAKSGIPVFVLRKAQGTDFFLPLRLAGLIKKEKFNLVHTHNQAAWFYGAPAARIAGAKIIHTNHTTADYHNYHARRWHLIEWMLSLVTQRITTVAKSVADYMIQREGISPAKIEVVYNGVKTELYEPDVDSSKKRKELALTVNNFVIGNVARLVSNKDHQTLINAFKIIAERIPEARLVIAGDGPLKNELQDLAKGLGLQDKIKLLGNRRDVPELLKTFDIFALSSLREGFPVVLLEAMAAGRPVVSSDVDGNAELIINDETGLIVPPGQPQVMAEAIEKLFKNPEKTKSMGLNGKKRVKEFFSFEIMISRYERIYADLGGVV